MSAQELEELRRELQQERRDKEAAEAREAQERRDKEAAEAREAQEQRKNQMTTLEEYLQNCHTLIYKRLVLADKSRSSTGATKVDGKFYPKRLCLWNDFADTLCQQHFDIIKSVCGERRLFPQEFTTRHIGSKVNGRVAGNENAIDHFEKSAVEDPVTDIFKCLQEDDWIRTKYQFTQLQFLNDIHQATQPGDGSQTMEGDDEENKGSNKKELGRRTRPDGCGIRTHSGGEEESLAFVYDYKLAHKIAVEHLRSALEKETLFAEVIERLHSNKILKDNPKLEEKRAELFISKALTQVFDYMVTYGVAYGYIAASKSLLFLYIDNADPQTLFCHPCIPAEDASGVSVGHLPYSAVAQLASFCLLSLRSEALKGASLDAAVDTAEAVLKKWGDLYERPRVEGDEPISSSPPLSQASSEVSEYQPGSKPTARTVSSRPRPSCKPTAILSPDDEDEEDEQGNGTSRSRTIMGKRKEPPSSNDGSRHRNNRNMSGSAPTRQYCTQGCLLGLKRGWDLDGDCLNVLSHRATAHSGGGGGGGGGGEGRTRHPINAREFARLVGNQLCRDPYQNCWALDGQRKMGATGLLFKLELAPYGYTFTAKGTVSSYLPRLQHEGRIYTQLERLQGQVVPVHLGLVHLDWGYILPGGTRIVYMMLMSWAGEPVARVASLTGEMKRSVQHVWAEGVDHGDLRTPNILWNDECHRVMLIDFDRATSLPKPKHKQVLELVGSGKRRKVSGQLTPSSASGSVISPP